MHSSVTALLVPLHDGGEGVESSGGGCHRDGGRVGGGAHVGVWEGGYAGSGELSVGGEDGVQSVARGIVLVVATIVVCDEDGIIGSRESEGSGRGGDVASGRARWCVVRSARSGALLLTSRARGLKGVILGGSGGNVGAEHSGRVRSVADDRQHSGAQWRGGRRSGG
jgi:hypothetical protein